MNRTQLRSSLATTSAWPSTPAPRRTLVLGLVLPFLLLLFLGGCGDDDGGNNNENGNGNSNGNGVCGDGVLDPGEQCDDGVDNSDTRPNACRTDCRIAHCGDGVQDQAEECDDGNASNQDGCLTACEGADDCCALNICGDGYQDRTPAGTDELVEACDDGNLEDDDDCSADCQQDHTLCGDGTLDQGEECDDGNLNSDAVADACRRDCTAPRCGDGVKDSGEACDGTDFGSRSCADEGYPGGGSLTCDGSCVLSSANCCQDNDGDGYGTNCDLGADCADDTPGLTGACEADGCPPGFVLVPAGDFEMGCDVGELGGACPVDAVPRHTVTLGAYCIARREVTVAEYKACRANQGCGEAPVTASANNQCNFDWGSNQLDPHPINCVSWGAARVFCQSWMGGDLPTEAQWEKAARGTQQNKYPWGNTPEPDCSHANFDVNGPADGGVGDGWGCSETWSGPLTWEPGHIASAGDSPYGLQDAAGNVSEYVRDCYDLSFYSTCGTPCTDPVYEPAQCQQRITRGGSWKSSLMAPELVTVDRREWSVDGSATIGMRCVRAP